MTFLFLFASLFFSYPAAQQESQNDPAAEELMNAVSSKYSAYEDIHALFILEIYNPQGSSEVQEGEVWLKDDKFRVKMPGQEMVSDNENIWIIMEDIEEIQIDYYTPDEESIDPSQLFTIYQEDFLYKVKGTVTEGGKELRVVEMTPFDKEQTYFKIDVTLDPTDLLIKKVLVYERSGVKYTYEMLHQESNSNLAADLFTVVTEKEPYLGWDILDLR